MMNNQNIALIDIGSNSIRLVIFRLEKSGFYKEIQNLKVVARLSSHIDIDGNMTKKGISTLVESLQMFQEITRTYHVSKTKCVATAAIRQSLNQNKIVKKVREETDFSIRVLSEYEEAYFGFLAVVNSTNIDDGITIDIGGGSTEVTLFRNRKLIHYHSFPFGAITLKQKFIKSEIPTNEELTNLKKYLIEQFQSLAWLKNKDVPLIGIGGSARNLSLIHQRKTNYPLSGLHQYTMNFESLREISLLLKTLTFKQRQTLDGLSKDRADIIIPAAEAIFTLMEVAEAKTFIMSNKGLRDGLFYEELFLQLNIENFPNVAEESFYQLSQDYFVNIEHVKYISKLSFQLYHEFKNVVSFDLTESDLRLLQLSCRVIYLGEFISHESSNKHTFYLLTNLSIDGLTHIERLKLSLIASFKSRSALYSYIDPFIGWFQKEEIEKIELLGAILKFAYCLNKTKRYVASKVAIVEKTDEIVKLNIQCFLESYFEELQAQKHKKHLEKITKKQIELLFSKKT